MAVPLPGRIPVSALVTMARDPAALAEQVRRPMPQPPAPQARRGTEFHRWLEQRFGPRPLIDPDELLGAADEDASAAADPDLAVLKERFEAGEWAERWPAEVEIPFETLIGDRLVRGRIDAVFADAPEGGFDVVDWKTGRPPGSPDERRAVAVQLAAYRLAWAALAGVPVSQVRAAFYYVRDDITVRPADLLDEAGLAALIEAVPVAARGRRSARQVAFQALDLGLQGPGTAGLTSALSVRLTRGARAATASTARFTTSITSSQSPSMVVNIASVRFSRPLSLTTRTASATYSATASPTPSGVTENATSI